jgi:hypothetical protein
VKKETLKAIIRAAHLTDEQYAVFFNSKSPTMKSTRESEEEWFRETVEADGTKHLVCQKCGQALCHTRSLEELDVARRDHPGQCTRTL